MNLHMLLLHQDLLTIETRHNVNSGDYYIYLVEHNSDDSLGFRLIRLCVGKGLLAVGGAPLVGN